MLKAFEFCIPATSNIVPEGPDWLLHEIKCDGYHLRLKLDVTRSGYNWTDRYLWIVEEARKNRHRQFVIDGEAVINPMSMKSG